MIYIIVTSHMARKRVLSALNTPKRQCYYSWDRDNLQGIYNVSDDELEQLKGIKGWRKLRAPYTDLLECIM